MLETILGWDTLTHSGSEWDEKKVIVFSHTSYWDFLVWLMYFKTNLMYLGYL